MSVRYCLTAALPEQAVRRCSAPLCQHSRRIRRKAKKRRDTKDGDLHFTVIRPRRAKPGVHESEVVQAFRAALASRSPLELDFDGVDCFGPLHDIDAICAMVRAEPGLIEWKDAVDAGTKEVLHPPDPDHPDLQVPHVKLLGSEIDRYERRKILEQLKEDPTYRFRVTCSEVYVTSRKGVRGRWVRVATIPLRASVAA